MLQMPKVDCLKLFAVLEDDNANEQVPTPSPTVEKQ